MKEHIYKLVEIILEFAMLLSMQYLDVNILITCNFVIFEPEWKALRKTWLFARMEV